MSNIVGLVGSPRRDQGLTHRAVSAALEGARSAGAETRIEYLLDWKVAECVDCGAPCFTDGVCVLSDSVTELSELVNRADGIVLGAPVYLWQVNALTHAFIDRYRIPGRATLARRPNGRPALAIAVAGGTGTGFSGAIRSLLDFLCLWGYRALDPIAVTRYNLDEALGEARERGKALAEAAGNPRPFARLAELLTYYDGLTFGCQDHVDEMIWLAEKAKHLGHSDTERIEWLCQEARALKNTDLVASAEKAVLAFVVSARAALVGPRR